MKRLAVCFLLLIMLSTSLSCVNSADYENLSSDYQQITHEHNELLSEYNNIVDDYNKLDYAYTQSVTDYNKLLSDYNQLLTNYNDSIEKYKERLDNIQKNIDQIFGGLEKEFEGAIIPPYILIEDRKVNLVFRNLDNELEHWYWEVEALEASILNGQLMRTMEISHLRYLGLLEIANMFYSGNKYVQIGQTRALDFRPYILEEPFEALALSFFVRHTNEEGNIREVWNMVTQLNKYSTEIKETPRLPLETLLLGGGDCEDLAILTASILKAMSSEWEVSLVYMDSENPVNFIKLNHVTVYVDTGKYRTFVECTSDNIMSPWEQVDGFYFEAQ